MFTFSKFAKSIVFLFSKLTDFFSSLIQNFNPMEASASEVNPSLGSKKKEKRKKGSRPRFEEPTEPGSSKGWY